jgi:hypothetical protein
MISKKFGIARQRRQRAFGEGAEREAQPDFQINTFATANEAAGMRAT